MIRNHQLLRKVNNLKAVSAVSAVNSTPPQQHLSTDKNRLLSWQQNKILTRKRSCYRSLLGDDCLLWMTQKTSFTKDANIYLIFDSSEHVLLRISEEKPAAGEVWAPPCTRLPSIGLNYIERSTWQLHPAVFCVGLVHKQALESPHAKVISYTISIRKGNPNWWDLPFFYGLENDSLHKCQDSSLPFCTSRLGWTSPAS